MDNIEEMQKIKTKLQKEIIKKTNELDTLVYRIENIDKTVFFSKKLKEKEIQLEKKEKILNKKAKKLKEKEIELKEKYIQ